MKEKTKKAQAKWYLMELEDENEDTPLLYGRTKGRAVKKGIY